MLLDDFVIFILPAQFNSTWQSLRPIASNEAAQFIRIQNPCAVVYVGE
jgi:hypothetical protein